MTTTILLLLLLIALLILFWDEPEDLSSDHCYDPNDRTNKP